MATQTKVMELMKETKGTGVYGCKDMDAAVSTVYVNKSFLGNPVPGTIKITVEKE